MRASRVLCLLFWVRYTKSFLLSLRSYTIQHIFRENNLTANGLSKEALQLVEGYLFVEEQLHLKTLFGYIRIHIIVHILLFVISFLLSLYNDRFICL